MANQNDSFIDEVTDDLRRDRLFNLFRRWGWVAALLIVAIVAGVMWREWSQSDRREAAQAWGDSMLTAEATGEPATIAAVDPDGAPQRQTLTALLAASAWADADDKDAAATALRDVAGREGQDATLHDLAELKLVMLEGDDMDPAERDTMLQRLSRAGAPFELLALEQKAVALIGADRTEDAVTLIRQIQQKDGLSQTLRRRLSEMMISLGIEPEIDGNRPAG